ncbi:hypothetical protein [Massiliimalia massiliensis]|uniref:hypothetical protein n=1 Tax=Massiliimalia massiliensis TaxID=1852384 RepID=UPI00135662A0|nr:hypothetical protein [Massiliimalia massiliensis]
MTDFLLFQGQNWRKEDSIKRFAVTGIEWIKVRRSLISVTENQEKSRLFLKSLDFSP